jgi:uncharacterized membrane protein
MHDTPASRDTLVVPRPSQRLTGIDAARGLALIGLMAIHILPDAREDTGGPTLAFSLFYGHSAALFALLAGVGLALSTGGKDPHHELHMRADRVGLSVRAGLVGIVGLLIATTMTSDDPPAEGILLYYAVFFLLAIPFLRLGPRALFLSALAFGIVAPILMQQLGPVLPESSAYNHTVLNLFTEPAGTASELLLTGTYPALPYMTYLLVGLGLGRLDLRRTSVQAWVAGTGAALAVLAGTVSSILLQAAGGYEQLLEASDASSDTLDAALVFGPDDILDTNAWWLAIATPHSNMPLAIASSLGIALLVLGVFLLLGRLAGRWLEPLYAMGAMTLTLYAVHLVALAFELHYDSPLLWFTVHLVAAVVFAVVWSRRFGRGPLEKTVSVPVNRAKALVLDGAQTSRVGTTEATEETGTTVR